MEIALDLIEHRPAHAPDIDDLPLDDPKTFELLRRADTIGVFQLEGGADARAVALARADHVRRRRRAVIALYRPGPMAQNWHNEYADRKNGRKPIAFDHPDLEEILGPTFGLMIYQEQLMRVSQKLAGYSLEEADNLRKATGKKIRALIAKERSEVRRGLRRATGTRRSSPRSTSTRSSRSPTTRSTSRTPSATATSRTRPRG